MDAFWTRWTALTHALIAAAEAGDVETFAAIAETRGEMLEAVSGTFPPREGATGAAALEERLRRAAARALSDLGRAAARSGAPSRASERAASAYRAA